MSSPQDNEADHDDRPTDESPPLNRNIGTTQDEALKEFVNEDINATVSPQIDLFIRNFKDPEKGVLADRRKSEQNRKKSSRKSLLKRSGSAV